jgi:transglutaminase-like putative cysteine protease
LILGFVGVTVLQLVATDESIISAAIRFVLLLTLVKFFGRFSHRDDLQIYALSFLIFASATAVNEGVTYGILFGFYVLAGTFSLALFHLNVELDDKPSVRGSGRTPFDRTYVMVLGAISVLIFVSSLMIFFVFPRVGLGFFVTQSREQTSVTGFSESVDLGSHGKIRDNPEVVMRVEFPKGRPNDYQTLHWRTMTFDRYDGTSWSRTLKETEKSLPRRQNGYQFNKLLGEWRAGFSAKTQPQVLQIYLEPIGTNLLPRLWPTGTVSFGNGDLRMPWNPNSGSLTVDAYGDLRHTVESEVGVPYSQTVLGKPDPERLREQTFASRRRGPDPRYLQLPELSEEFYALVDEATAGTRTPYEKAEAVMEHLGENFQYTTDLPPVDQGRPIESFVFETKRGHCEYFATTGVLMLRAAGVPARLVNGFLGGRWNGVGGYLSVRQGDAHSWVEIYVPNFGWTPIDPTPAADVLPMQPDPFTQWYRDSYDALRLNWMKWVIEYDLESQIELFKKAGKFLAPKPENLDGGDKEASKDRSFDLDGAYVLYLLGLFVLAALFWWLIRRWFGRESGVHALFERIERAGKAAGVARAPDEGPGAYLERLGRAFPPAARELAAFRQRYLAARFGGRSPGARQMQGLGELVAKIRKKLK